MNVSAITTFITDQIRVDPLDSKKFLAVLTGGALVLLMFLISSILVFINPTGFASFSGFATTAVTVAAGLFGSYIGGQAYVEGRANKVLQQAVAPADPPKK